MKRLGALLLKTWAVPMVPIGLGLMLYGLLDRGDWENPFSVGVVLIILGALLWLLARKLDAEAHLVRYRRRQNRLLRLARERGGRLTVTEAAAEAGFTVEETEEMLKSLLHRGYAELEITDSGMMVYRFPEVLFAHEKVWSRPMDQA